MRITIKFDSATTEELRGLLRAMNRAGHKDTQVHLNGPECFSGQTAPLRLEDAHIAIMAMPAPKDEDDLGDLLAAAGPVLPPLEHSSKDCNPDNIAGGLCPTCIW